MTDWEPGKYQQFQDERSRPARDLMAQIRCHAPENIIDLGCGAGLQAAQLKERWPTAQVTGVDSSARMLEQARASYPDGITWIQDDIADYEPERPIDILFSNAALQWLDDHTVLFPKLAGWLGPGGTMAVQMPRNFDAPSHQVMRDVAKSGPWAARLAGIRDASPVAEPVEYYRILRPRVRHLDIWETIYTHVLEGDDPVARWTRSTGLRPFLNALSDDEAREAFYEAYAQALRKHYPRQDDDRTLFSFRRIFIVGKSRL